MYGCLTSSRLLHHCKTWLLDETPVKLGFCRGECLLLRIDGASWWWWYDCLLSFVVSLGCLPVVASPWLLFFSVLHTFCLLDISASVVINKGSMLPVFARHDFSLLLFCYAIFSFWCFCCLVGILGFMIGRSFRYSAFFVPMFRCLCSFSFLLFAARGCLYYLIFDVPFLCVEFALYPNLLIQCLCCCVACNFL